MKSHATLHRLLLVSALLAGVGLPVRAQTLNAHPGPADASAPSGSGIFFDLSAIAAPVRITHLRLASSALPGAPFSVEIFTRDSTALGGTLSNGPGSSMNGWTSLGSVPATQGPAGSNVSTEISLREVMIGLGLSAGVAVVITQIGHRYATAPGGPTVYSDGNLALTTGEVRSHPFTQTGTLSSGELVGSIRYEVLQPSAYCTGKLNSQGCTPSIGSSGAMSATATSGFVLRASNELNNKVGLVLYSEFGRDAVAFGAGGILCVKAPTRRSKGFHSGGTPPPASDCSGVFTIDFNAFGRGLLGSPPNPAAYLSLPGQVVTAQFWGRDPGLALPDNFSLSDGLEFTVAP